MVIFLSDVVNYSNFVMLRETNFVRIICNKKCIYSCCQSDLIGFDEVNGYVWDEYAFRLLPVTKYIVINM